MAPWRSSSCSRRLASSCRPPWPSTNAEEMSAMRSPSPCHRGRSRRRARRSCCTAAAAASSPRTASRCQPTARRSSQASMGQSARHWRATATTWLRLWHIAASTSGRQWWNSRWAWALAESCGTPPTCCRTAGSSPGSGSSWLMTVACCRCWPEIHLCQSHRPVCRRTRTASLTTVQCSAPPRRPRRSRSSSAMERARSSCSGIRRSSWSMAKQCSMWLWPRSPTRASSPIAWTSL
mmetsp:Transcript_23995/g.65421  ORF Transcript_23995/g.65421 Transcript_23995/m.65421 type:complete len:236 (+) Transcript_23995:296-1003(+)